MRHQSAHDPRRRALVLRVGVRVQKAHGDRLDVLAKETLRRALDAGRVERGDQRAVRSHALGNGQAQPARHDRLGRVVTIVVHFLADAAAHLQRVAKAARGEKAGTRRLSGEHRIRGHRGAVHDDRDPGEKRLQIRRLAPGELGQTAQHRLGRVGRRGELLVDRGAPARIHEKKIRERSADVDADSVAHFVDLEG